jgi:hypothetical protein
MLSIFQNQYLLYYIMVGVVLNAAYDFIISRIDKEELRLNMAERLVFCAIWPIYFIFFLFNFIKHNTNNNDDE